MEYQSSSTFDSIRAGTTIRLHSFHDQLITYMMTIDNIDPSRAGERINQNDSTYVNTNVLFGFGREQKFPNNPSKSTCIHYTYKGTKMPTISSKDFLVMPRSIHMELHNLSSVPHKC